jgi:hypothetical protein
MVITNTNNIKKELDKYPIIDLNVDAHGTFYSINSQKIQPNNSICFEQIDSITNLGFDINTTEIKILYPGMYMCHLNCHFDQSCQIALYINDKPELSTLTKTESRLNIIIINQNIQLNSGDVISFKNYMGWEPITTSEPLVHIKENKNIQLNIWKIC